MKIPSDNPQETLHALFPTLVYQHHCDPALFQAAFESARANNKAPEQNSNAPRHNAGEYHGQILLHQQPELRPFFDHLARCVAAYFNAIGMKPELFEIQCLKSWLVTCEAAADGDETAMVVHNHSCSDISWVYYVDVPEECPAITFHAGRRLATEPFSSAFHYDWHQDEKSSIQTVNWWNSETWSIHPQAGDLLIFPGRQLHSVEANHTNQPRHSAAGDIAVTLKSPHTALEFGRTNPAHWLNLPLPD